MNRQSFFDGLHHPITALAAIVAIPLASVTFYFATDGKLPAELRAGIIGVVMLLWIWVIYRGVTAWIKPYVDKIRNLFEVIGNKDQELGPAANNLVTNDVLHTYFSSIYGLSYDDLRVHGAVNEQGGMTIRRMSSVTSQTTELTKLDHYLLSESSDAKDIQVELVCNDPYRQLSSEIRHIKSNELLMTIGISPPLMPSEILSFTVNEITPAASVTTTKGEMESRIAEGKKHFDYEAFFWEITQPTSHFELKLIIPEKLKPQNLDFEVWYGPSRITHAKERERIKRKNWFEYEVVVDHIEATLEVTYPIPTLIYAIRWRPPEGLSN